MKRVMGLAVAVGVTASLLSAASAAPEPNAREARLATGLKNARKAAAGMQERDKKVREVRKEGQAKRQQAQLAGQR